ncbi:uncharacterized protein N7515_002895 [Penicillium bovifimosum]|uniref:DUF1279 domain-containing protein n=1 Tax=Penicillium bovifimosum TaxID=126998 RepID=A0A9W9L9P4_9EURO|nr:uncharacterized protein N7515_002895 [Penicillium bovifimosum]KAJ5144108.1 hypothetical protein N7515_002895 [Penicillium bovifimosum]
MTTSLRPSLRWLQPLLKTKPTTTLQLQRQFLPRFTSAPSRTYTTAPFRQPRTPFRTLPNRRFNSNFSGAGASSKAKAEETLTLSQRLKKLSREYGWAALGVYLGLSALDFPFCFAAVRLLGVERIGYYEHVVVSFVKDSLKSVWPGKMGGGEEDGQGQLAQAEERNQEEASIWTQLVFAYAIHKSFIFIRVPLTAAVTPKVVKILRGWGWDIGKRKPKST